MLLAPIFGLNVEEDPVVVVVGEPVVILNVDVGPIVVLGDVEDVGLVGAVVVLEVDVEVESVVVLTVVGVIVVLGVDADVGPIVVVGLVRVGVGLDVTVVVGSGVVVGRGGASLVLVVDVVGGLVVVLGVIVELAKVIGVVKAVVIRLSVEVVVIDWLVEAAVNVSHEELGTRVVANGEDVESVVLEDDKVKFDRLDAVVVSECDKKSSSFSNESDEKSVTEGKATSAASTG